MFLRVLTAQIFILFALRIIIIRTVTRSECGSGAAFGKGGEGREIKFNDGF